MSLKYLIDENLLGPLATAIRRHNRTGGFVLDVVCVGEPVELPLGSSDPAILLWAEKENRILITEDRSTMPRHLAAHLAASASSPGVFLLRPGVAVRLVVEFLVVAAYASKPSEWENHTHFIPT